MLSDDLWTQFELCMCFLQAKHHASPWKLYLSCIMETRGASGAFEPQVVKLQSSWNHTFSMEDVKV